MDGPLAGGDLDGRDAGIVRERVSVGKPGSLSAAADQANGQHWSDTVNLKQSGGVVLKRFGHLGGDRPQPGIDVSDLPYQVPCQRLAGRLWWCVGADLAEKRRSCVGPKRCGRTARNQVSQQGVELVVRPDPLGRQVRPPLPLIRANTTVSSWATTTEASPWSATTLAAPAASITSFLRLPPRDNSRTRAVAAVDASNTTSSWATNHRGEMTTQTPGRSPPPNVAARTDAPNATTARNPQWWHQIAPTTPTCSSPRPLP